MRDNNDTGGGMMSAGQALAILLLAPLVLLWVMDEMGIDPVGPVIALLTGGM